MAAVLTHFFPGATSRFMGQRAVAQPETSISAKANLDQEIPPRPQPNDEPEAHSSNSASEEAAEVRNAAKNPEVEDDEYEDSGDDEDHDTDFKNRDLRQSIKTERGARTRKTSTEGSDSSSVNESDSDSASSEAEASWQADEGEGEEEDTIDATNDANLCIHCGQDEAHDPSDEFEEYLACVVCGNNSHRQCAREAGALGEQDEADYQWRCQNCLMDDFENMPPHGDNQSHFERRRSSAPKIARDLLPAQSDAAKPGYHTIFGSLILDDDPMDGSRSLRKRKSFEDEGEKSPESRKRLRRGTSDVSSRPIAQQDTGSTAGSMIELTPTRRPQPPVTKARSSRARVSRRPVKHLITRDQSEDALHLIFHLPPVKLLEIAREPQKRKRRERERERARRAQAQRVEEQEQISHYPALQPMSFSSQMLSLVDREGDGNKSSTYGGILSEAEADTIKTFPQAIDRKKFEDARMKAEEGWKRKVQAASTADTPRPQKPSGSASKIKCINFGGYEVDTWHDAPYPEEYSQSRVLYICEFCLKYMNSDFVAWRHKLKCPAKHPPGDEIYRDGQLSFFEVDGRKNPVYCQNLCLLAKLFLGSKTLYYDVEPFLFYIMTENDEFGCHFVGYFSKEKRPSSLNNVSCILVLPIHQRRGFGHLLIDFSYLLTRVEQKTGSPEKPLSDMGLVSYRSYWRLVLCYQLLKQKDAISISDISHSTGMTADDIVCALEGLRALVRDPVTKQYAMRLDYPFFQEYITRYESKGYAQLNPDSLIWVPYVMGRDNMHYENAAPLHTVAQRDEEHPLTSPEEGVQQLEAKDADELDPTSSQDADVLTPLITTPQEGEHDSIEVDNIRLPNDDVAHQTAAVLTPVKPASNTPWIEGTPRNPSPIPATRFEIFPPVKGTSSRKRQARSFARGLNRRGTPVRRNLSFGDPCNTPAGKPAAVRRTRSRLAEVANDDGDADADANDGESEMLPAVESPSKPGLSTERDEQQPEARDANEVK